MVILKTIEMKSRILYIIILCVLSGCEIDNYKMPELTFSGKTLDFQTEEFVESSGADAGS
jgi:hypothetical protein